MQDKKGLHEVKENGKITLDRIDLKALSSDVRLEILKKLDRECKTLRKLSEELNLAKSTIHENLTVLIESGFVKKKNTGSKWVHYELTEKGRNILHPHEKIKIVIILSSAILSYIGGITEIYLFIIQKHPEVGVKGAPFHLEHLVLGFIFVILGTVLLYMGSRLRKRQNRIDEG